MEHNKPFSHVNDHNPDNVRKYGDARHKVYADCYIDDKNLGSFDGWLAVEQQHVQHEINEEREFNEMIYPGLIISLMHTF